jgi:E3 ubiquitin-protein ligase BAH
MSIATEMWEKLSGANGVEMTDMNRGSSTSSQVGIPPGSMKIPETVLTSNVKGDLEAVRPRLVFSVDAKSGVPVDAKLSSSTREYLLKLAERQRLKRANGGISPNIVGAVPPEADFKHTGSATVGPLQGGLAKLSIGPNAGLDVLSIIDGQDEAIQSVVIPLSHDSEFFYLLTEKLSKLDALQADERDVISKDVEKLGKTLSMVTVPPKGHARSDLYPWRDIFEIYIEAGVFFSNHEIDHGHRSSADAQKQLTWFLEQIDKRKMAGSFKRKESKELLGRFISVNLELLQNLKFQEINQLAMSKILKSE